MPPAPRALKFRSIGAPFALRTVQQMLFAVDKLVLRAARKGPMIVELYVPDAGWMRIGIGLGKSVLSYRPTEEAAKGKNGRRAAVSIGSRNANDDVVYWTWCEDNRHGYERKNLIESATAMRALSHFFETGELAGEVRWDEFEPGLV